MYALISNGKVEKYPYSIGDLRRDNPQTSFPKNPPDNLLAEWGVYPVTKTPQPSYNYLTQTVVEVTPVQEDGVWVQTWEVQNLPDDVCEQNNKNQAVSLLQQTDWTSIPDVANPAVSNPYLTNQAAFLSYRSQIRAIAVNPPVLVDPWPVCPNEIWSS